MIDEEVGTEADNARAERVEAGWNIGEDTATATDADVKREMTETFGEDKLADNWQVGRPETKPAEPEPKPTGLRPREDDVSEAQRLGIDYDQASEFLSSHPGLEQRLSESGAITARPQTDAEFRGNLAAVELLRERTENAVAGQQAFQDAIVADAYERYEAGEEEPQEIADELLQSYGPNVAAEFVREWHSDETEYEEPEPLSAAQWAAREQARQQVEAAAWVDERGQAAAALAQREEQEAVRAVEERVAALRQQHPDFAQVAPRMAALAVQAGITEADPALADMLYNAAKEEMRAEDVAKAEQEMDHEFFRLDRAGFMGSERGLPPPETREQLMAKHLNPDVVTQQRKTREQFEAEVVFDDDRTRALDAGFALIDKFDVHERSKQQMLHRKGY